MSNKPTDKVIYTANQNILIPLKSIAYSQALRFHKICYNRSDLHNNCKQLLNTLTKRGYNKKILQQKSTMLFQFQEKELLNKIKTSNTGRLPLTVTYNRILPDLKTIIGKICIFYKWNQN